MNSFSEQSSRQRAIELLRWMGVLPVAWGCSFIAGGIAFFFATLLVFNELSYEGFDRVIRHVIMGCPAGAAFVVAGVWMAPRGRLATSVVLSVLWYLSVLLVHHQDYLPVVVAAVAAVTGGTCAAYIFRSRNRVGGTPGADHLNDQRD